jgi:hypothetical protein
MMDTKNQFSRIFEEAQVIDLDFSKWDQFIRIVVVALNYPADENNRSSLFNIDFVDVSEFRWKAHHLDIELDEPTQHCQWTIFKHKYKESNLGYEIWLGDVAPPSPEITIYCRHITITALSWDVVFTANPNWHGSHLPLARPSLDEIKGTLES